MNLYEAQLRRYLGLGWSVFPIPNASKRPQIPWMPYQGRKATDAEVKTWARVDDQGIAVVTGSNSGLLVIDEDNIEEGDTDAQSFLGGLPPTATVKTGKGRHFYFTYDYSGGSIRNATRIVAARNGGIDIRGEGGYVIAPPSIHSSGSVYYWLSPPEDGIAQLPDGIVAKLLGGPKSKSDGELAKDNASSFERDWNSPPREGERNSTLAKLAGLAYRESAKRIWPVVTTGLSAWGASTNPPMDDREVAATLASIEKLELEARRREGREDPYHANLDPVGAQDLARMDLAAPRFLVERLLPRGLSMLVGSPKDGKSFIALQLAIATARGGCAPFPEDISTLAAYGSFKTAAPGQGVLYLALEDSLYRIKKRLLDMVGGEANVPDGLCLATTVRPLFDGGLGEIRAWLEGTPNAGLVIIDTLSALLAGGKNSPQDGKGNVFMSDYRTLKPLLDLAREKQIGVLVVHHKRKGAPNIRMAFDPIESPAGSGGMTAVIDALWAIERPAGAKGWLRVHTTGRDLEQQIVCLQRNGSFGWKLMAPPNSNNPTG